MLTIAIVFCGTDETTQKAKIRDRTENSKTIRTNKDALRRQNRRLKCQKRDTGCITRLWARGPANCSHGLNTRFVCRITGERSEGRRSLYTSDPVSQRILVLFWWSMSEGGCEHADGESWCLHKLLCPLSLTRKKQNANKCEKTPHQHRALIKNIFSRRLLFMVGVTECVRLSVRPSVRHEIKSMPRLGQFFRSSGAGSATGNPSTAGSPLENCVSFYSNENVCD